MECTFDVGQFRTVRKYFFVRFITLWENTVAVNLIKNMAYIFPLHIGLVIARMVLQ